MTIENILTQMRTHATKHDIPIIDGPTRQYIDSLLEELKPKHCLEIGTAIWYSTMCISEKISQRGGTIISCEISHPAYMTALWYQSLIQNSTLLLNSILYYGNFFKFSIDFRPKQFDFVFIDGQKSEYLDYMHHLKPLVHSDTVLIFDDIIKFSNKIAPLLEHLKQNSIPHEIIHLGDDDGILQIIAKDILW